jgi:multidrug efflux pump
MEDQVNAIQDSVMDYVDAGEVQNIVTMTPGWGGGGGVNSGMTIISLPSWEDRTKQTSEVMSELNKEWAEIPGVRAFMFMRSGLGRGGGGVNFDAPNRQQCAAQWHARRGVGCHLRGCHCHG